MMDDIEERNYESFRDILSTSLIENSTLTTKQNKKPRVNNRRKTAIKRVSIDQKATNDAEELAEFIEYMASEVFNNFPPELRSLTYSTWLNTPSLQSLYTDSISTGTFSKILNTLPPSVSDSLLAYEILPPHQTPPEFLLPILQTYITSIITAPPPPSKTKNLVSGCEICERQWIPLTYHHLIPRGAHAKALKRGWHTEDQLANVAWLCRACHSFVHRVATLEDLAREWYTVERLLDREDVRDFAKWVGKIRWKSK